MKEICNNVVSNIGSIKCDTNFGKIKSYKKRRKERQKGRRYKTDLPKNK